MKLGCAGSEWTCIQWSPPHSLACKWLCVDVFERSAACVLPCGCASARVAAAASGWCVVGGGRCRVGSGMLQCKALDVSVLCVALVLVVGLHLVAHL